MLDIWLIRIVLSFALQPFGWCVVPLYMGHWSVVDGKLHRSKFQIGWRACRLDDARGQMTALDLFCRDRGLNAPTPKQKA